MMMMPFMKCKLNFKLFTRVRETKKAWHQNIKLRGTGHRGGGSTPRWRTSSVRGPSRSLACSASPRSSVPAPLFSDQPWRFPSQLGGWSLRAQATSGCWDAQAKAAHLGDLARTDFGAFEFLGQPGAAHELLVRRRRHRKAQSQTRRRPPEGASGTGGLSARVVAHLLHLRRGLHELGAAGEGKWHHCDQGNHGQGNGHESYLHTVSRRRGP